MADPLPEGTRVVTVHAGVATVHLGGEWLGTVRRHTRRYNLRRQHTYTWWEAQRGDGTYLRWRDVPSDADAEIERERRQHYPTRTDAARALVTDRQEATP